MRNRFLATCCALAVSATLAGCGVATSSTADETFEPEGGNPATASGSSRPTPAPDKTEKPSQDRSDTPKRQSTKGLAKPPVPVSELAGDRPTIRKLKRDLPKDVRVVFDGRWPRSPERAKVVYAWRSYILVYSAYVFGNDIAPYRAYTTSVGEGLVEVMFRFIDPDEWQSRGMRRYFATHVSRVDGKTVVLRTCQDLSDWHRWSSKKGRGSEMRRPEPKALKYRLKRGEGGQWSVDSVGRGNNKRCRS